MHRKRKKKHKNRVINKVERILRETLYTRSLMRPNEADATQKKKILKRMNILVRQGIMTQLLRKTTIKGNTDCDGGGQLCQISHPGSEKQGILYLICI